MARHDYAPDYDRPPSRPYPHPSESDFDAERYDLEFTGRGWGYGVGYEGGVREDVMHRGEYAAGPPEVGYGGFRQARRLGDDEIRDDVQEALFQDSWIEPDRIEVEVDNGIVTLKGEVRDFMEARYAWDDAWDTPGVRGVINQLTVQPEGEEAPEKPSTPSP